MLADVAALKPIPRPVAASLEELLDGATAREPFLHSDSKSGVGFERVVVGGEPHILKHVHIDHDWTMRFFGETTCIPVDVWRHGLMDVLDDRIDHATVAVAAGLGRDGLGGALLMRDVGPAMVPAGDEPLPLQHHLQLLDDLAGLGARMWGWTDDVGLLPLARLVRLPRCVEITVTVKLLVAPAAKLPRLQITWLLAFVVVAGSALRNTNPAGKLSVTVTLAAVDGPALLTVMV